MRHPLLLLCLVVTSGCASTIAEREAWKHVAGVEIMAPDDLEWTAVVSGGGRSTTISGRGHHIAWNMDCASVSRGQGTGELCVRLRYGLKGEGWDSSTEAPCTIVDWGSVSVCKPNY